MKRILCYGDSNTWGYEPFNGRRFDEQTRWTGIAGAMLGSGYQMVEEGLCGRTTVWDDPIEGYKNGATYLIPCLESHRPLDLVILMLGTNDLKNRFSLSAYDIAQGIGTLVKIIGHSGAGREGNAPPVLLLAPPPTARLSNFAASFIGAGEKSRRFGEEYVRVARETGCAFLDTATVIVSSPADGIHFEAAEHQKLGLAVTRKVQELIG